jgi:ketosteroid isomerase-like protein
MKIRSIIAAVIAIGFVVAGCSSSSEDPASVLADYAEARNSGDIDAVMALYADDAVVMDQVFDDDGVATGIDEIRVLEEQIPAVQGSGDGIEIFDVVVSGSTATFKTRFFYGADGVRNTSGSAGCSGSLDHTATVESGKITVLDWGIGSSSLCS